MKTRFFLLLPPLLLFFVACSTKTTTYINGFSLLGKSKQEVSNKTLQQIADNIHTETNATLLYTKDAYRDSDGSLTLFLTNRYLKIMLDPDTTFSPGDTIPGNHLKKELDAIIPVLQKYPAVIIQIIGHAYDEGSKAQMRHYADLRAIAIAEYLYEKGLKQDILAKGCGNDVPRKICPSDKPHLLCSMRNRRIEIFIYSAKADVITRCR